MISLLRKFRISARIFIFLLVFATIPCILLFCNTIHEIGMINESDLERYTQTFRSLAENKLENEIYQNSVQCIKLFSDNTLTSIFDDASFPRDERQREILSAVNRKLEYSDEQYHISVVTDDGEEYRLFDDKSFGAGHADITDNVDAGGAILLGSIVRDQNGDSYLRVIQSLNSYDYHSEDKKVIMYLATDLLDNYYSRVKDNNDMICFITDSSDRIIFSNNRDIINSNNMFNNCFKADDGHQNELMLGGNYYIYTRSELDFSNKNMPSGLVINQILPKNLYHSAVNRFSYATGTTLILMIIMFALIGAALSYALTKPVRMMEQSVRAFGNGSEISDVILPAVTDDEIGELSVMIEEMFVRIRELIQNNTKILEEKHRIEFEVLQAQIDPHFIYNTLDIISSIAKLKGEEQIEEIVYALSSFFKVSLHNGDRYISVEEEIEHVKSYIKIQEIRWPGRFCIDFSVEEEILGCEIIKTILQPFVENAIKYAFEGREETGIIKIRAYKSGSFIIFEIEDNGAGFDTTVLDSNSYKGVGIKNTTNRIIYEYGSACGVSIESAQGKGTLVRIKVLCLEEI